MSAKENVFVPPSQLEVGEWNKGKLRTTGSEIIYRFHHVDDSSIFTDCYKVKNNEIVFTNSSDPHHFSHAGSLQIKLSKSEVIQRLPEAKHLLRKPMFYEAD